MTDDDLDALRAEVDRQTGPARAKPLTALVSSTASPFTWAHTLSAASSVNLAEGNFAYAGSFAHMGGRRRKSGVSPPSGASCLR